MERAGEPLMLCICAHTILLGSERPNLEAYPCHFLFAQCREIVDTANAMDGSVVHVVQHLGGGMSVSSRHRFGVTPPTSDAETRPRSACARLSRHAEFCRDAAAVAGERVLRVSRSRSTPGCDFRASLKWASPKSFPFGRLQAEAWRILLKIKCNSTRKRLEPYKIWNLSFPVVCSTTYD